MGTVVEIIFFIIAAVVFYVFILPFINTFGANSQHKNSGKIAKTREAFKQVNSNYKETKNAIAKGFKALEKGVDALEKESRTWPEKAEKFRLEECEKNYHRTKAKLAEINQKRREVGLKEVSLVDFFEDNKDYQERAKREEALSKKNVQAIQLADKNERKFKEINKQTEQKDVSPIKLDSVFHKEERKEQTSKKVVEEVTSTSTQKKLASISIDLDQLPKSLVEFIYIRYYLTGQTSLPTLQCIYDSWAKSIYADSELNEAQWAKIIEQMSLDSSKQKKIHALYHFTHKDNLISILIKGLMTKKRLEELNFKYKFNDEKRWDGVEDSISLSFSHPNHKMFMKYAKPTGLENWVVLKISPELLSGNTNPAYKELENYDYLDKAIFNTLNAASFKMKNLTIEERKSHKVFLDMFESSIGKTLETYTVDNQAEILYQGNIPKEFIQEVHVFEESPDLKWVKDLGFKLSVNKTVFEKR